MRRRGIRCAHLFSVLTLFLLSVTISAQRSGQGWVWQNPLPQGNQLLSIHFARDKENGFAVGSDNTILRTSNGGFSWEQQYGLQDVTFTDVYAFDARNAVVAGTRGTILITNNSGKEWRPAKADVKDHLYSLAFAGGASEDQQFNLLIVRTKLSCFTY